MESRRYARRANLVPVLSDPYGYRGPFHDLRGGLFRNPQV